jgi:transcriptional regulator with XRE-family HTH domain
LSNQIEYTLDKEKNIEILLLAKRIKELRQKNGYSNYEYFAYENNLPRAQYGRYEKGEDLRFSSLIKIIKAFNITPQEFFSEGFEEIFKD